MDEREDLIREGHYGSEAEEGDLLYEKKRERSRKRFELFDELRGVSWSLEVCTDLAIQISHPLHERLVKMQTELHKIRVELLKKEGA